MSQVNKFEQAYATGMVPYVVSERDSKCQCGGEGGSPCNISHNAFVAIWGQTDIQTNMMENIIFPKITYV